LGISRFTKKDLKKQKKSMLANPEDIKIPIDDGYVYENEYYLGISRIFRLFEYIFIMASILFAVGCVAAHPEIMSYNNFLMFVKDFNMSAVDTRRYTELLYDTDYTDEISLYKDGAAVPGSDSVFMFTATGRLAYTSQHSFDSPRLEASDSVALLYDFSSDSYALYNSYMRVYKGKSEAPIYGCSVSDSGAYAFIVRKSDGKFGVHVYSESNVRICSFESERYIISVSLNDSGDKISVLSLGVSDGERYTLLKVYSCTDGALLAERTLSGETPLFCGFLDGDSIAVLTDSSALFLDHSFANDVRVALSDISGMEICGDKLYAVCERRVLVFSGNGECIYDRTFDNLVRSVTVFDNTVFVLFPDSVLAYDIASKESCETPVKESFLKILATSDKHVILCGVSGASLVELD